MNFEGVNSVELQGELWYPELNYTKNGKALLKAKIGIPTLDERSGTERISYVRIVAWEEFAEYLGNLEPRSRVRVSGRIQERSFENNNGEKRNITEIIVNGVELVNSHDGINRFYLRGKVIWPEFKYVGENKQTALFKSKLIVPFYREDDLSTQRRSYVRITAWDDMAEGLNKAEEGTIVEVSGHIQERSWQPPRGQKRLFTDAIVTNFVLGSSEHAA